MQNKINDTLKKNFRSGYNEEMDSFPISFEPAKFGTFNIYLFGAIESPQQFVSCIEVMRQASPEDTVVIHLQSCGGSIDATDTLLQAIYECSAQVVVRASGGCHSAASLILLAADTFTLSENFSALLHNGSVGTGGKFSDYKAETLFTTKTMERVMRTTYAGFLDPSEIEDMLRGVDIWLDGTQWVERHNKRNAYLQSIAEADFSSQPIEQQAYMLAQSQLEEGTEPTQEDIDFALEYLNLPKEEPVAAKPTRKTTKK